MRNIPFPRFSIGHPEHRFFPVGDRRGLAQGIREVSDTMEMEVSDLVDFDLLPFPEVTRFDEETVIEIADFHGWTSHGGGFVSRLGFRRVRLEPGGRISGPVVWRLAGPSVAEPEAPPSRSDVVSVVLAVSVVIVSLVVTYLAVPELAIGVGIVIGFVCVLVWLITLFSRLKRNAIVKMGSAWVYSPARRLWASRSEAEVRAA